MRSPRGRLSAGLVLLLAISLAATPIGAGAQVRDPLAELRAQVQHANDFFGPMQRPAEDSDPNLRSDIDRLLAALRSGAESARARAAIDLAFYAKDSNRVVPALLEAMGDASVTVRRGAAFGGLLAFDGADGSLAPRVLMEIMKDPDPELRSQAVRRLGRVPIAPHLIDAVTDALGEALADPVQHVRGGAERALARQIETGRLDPGRVAEAEAARERRDASVVEERAAPAPARRPEPAGSTGGTAAPEPRAAPPAPEAMAGTGAAGAAAGGTINAAIQATWPGRNVVGAVGSEPMGDVTLYSGGVPLENDGLEDVMVAEYPSAARVAEQKQYAQEDLGDFLYDTRAVPLRGPANPGYLRKPQHAMRLFVADGSTVNSGQLFAQQILDFYCGTVNGTVDVQIATGVPWRRGSEPGTFDYDVGAAEAAVARVSGELRGRVLEVAQRLADNLAAGGYCR